MLHSVTLYFPTSAFINSPFFYIFWCLDKNNFLTIANVIYFFTLVTRGSLTVLVWLQGYPSIMYVSPGHCKIKQNSFQKLTKKILCGQTWISCLIAPAGCNCRVIHKCGVKKSKVNAFLRAILTSPESPVQYSGTSQSVSTSRHNDPCFLN